MSRGERSRRPAYDGRRTWVQRLVVAFGSLTAVALLLAGGSVWYLKRQIDNIPTVALGSALTPGAAAPAAADGKQPDVKNYLLVGSDSRVGADPSDPDYGSIGPDLGSDRSDTIMILRLDSTSGEASLLSLPRDLWVTISGTKSKNRINTAFGKGPAVLVRTIQENLGIPINHYLQIDFAGFKKLVDAVGGVSVWFDHQSRDTNTGLLIKTTGCVKLNGISARQYVRSRHFEVRDSRGNWQEDPSADLGRISRQQDFLKRMATKVASTNLSNPFTFNNLLSAAASTLTVDDQLDLIGLAGRLKSVKLGDVASYTVPVNVATRNGQSVVTLDANLAWPILALFQGKSTLLGSTPTSPANPSLTSPATSVVKGSSKTTAPSAGPIAPPTTTKPIGIAPSSSQQCPS